MPTVETARKIALSLPEVLEQDHFGSPSFRVRGKIFAQLSTGGARALVKLTAGDQAALIMSDPGTFSAAPHWGRHGWTYIELRQVDASLLQSLLRSSWKIVAPKKLFLSHPARKE